MESVAADLSYRVEYAGRASDTYRVKVFEYPEVRRADAEAGLPGIHGDRDQGRRGHPPRHGGRGDRDDLDLPPQQGRGPGHAGGEKGNVTPLKPQTEGTNPCAASFTLADSHRYKVKLVDRDGRANKVPTEIVVNVTRNRPATVAMTQPGRDVRVSPVEELTLRAQVEDDFGVVRHGLSYSVTGEETKDIELPGSKPALKKIKAEHLLAFEALKAQPDQLVTYFFWAEDIGPDGQPRRTSGDMYFAEVRHFEEIFRQGEPPPAAPISNSNSSRTATPSRPRSWLTSRSRSSTPPGN